MERKNISQKLNEVYKNSCKETPNLFSLVRFSEGDTKKKLYETASSLSPDGAVVVLFTENAEKKTVKDVTDGLRGACAKILSVKIPAETDVVRAAAGVLRVSEDARLIIAAEYSLVPLARYVSKISSLPFVYVMRTADIDGILSPRLFLKNGKRTDCFFADAVSRIIIDAEKIFTPNEKTQDAALYEKKASALLFAKLAGKIPALADYRARIYASGTKPETKAYELLREAVKDGYTAFTKKEKEILPSLIYDSFLAEIADLLSGGELYSLSALRFAEFLLAGEKRLSAAEILELYSRISGVYALYTSPLAEGLLEIPDYRARAHALAEMTGTDEGVFLKGFVKQSEKLNDSGINAENITDKLFEELKKQNVSASSVRSTFSAYGKDEKGKSEIPEEKMRAAIKLAGDSPFGINAMSIAREKGVTEFL